MEKKEKSIIWEGERVSTVSDSEPRRNRAGQFDLEEKERNKTKREAVELYSNLVIL